MIDFKEFFSAITSISTESLVEFKALFEPRVLKKGDYFIKEGQVANELGFLESGVMRVFYRNDKGTEYNKQFFVNPSLVGGYASLITNQPAKINQQALTDCDILVAKYADVQEFYSKYPIFERGARIIAEYYFVHKEQREIEIVLLDAEERYAIFQKEFPQLEQQIPQYHIASYLGITPIHLSRIRKKNSP
ncbi:Crp/Fnr family transcriptional regulator [Algoriphagus lacus]|uniref:Crp/Fnr family transcriptional regulator n=1 Tax=Algoriphagus lacus TaxID=2056311 RepID=A0A418PNW8_9BACT|nr:Crp/Fnr family transcriptional regulator [Algoriphagus lacus]RIW13411.1 Crp/Fnr family transcriptional regulator [Algoriphagus lacus]